MDKNEPLLEVRNLCKYYPVNNYKKIFQKHEIKAVDQLNLAIYPGEIFGLVGESGCGKSTAGYMLADIISPSVGEIIYCGKNIKEMNRNEKKTIRREIQMIFQDPYASLNPKKKIGWIIEEPLIVNFDYDKKIRKNLVDEMLETVGLDSGIKERYPHELSGGQRQRVNIAAALMLNSKMIIADESVSALDVSIQSQILNLLKELQKTKQLTYLFISHDLNVVQYMSDRIGVMYMGRLVEYGDVEEIYGNARHPYTKALLSAIPSVNDKKRQHIVLNGEVPSTFSPPTGCAFHTRCYRAKDICAIESPEMMQIENDHYACCHFAVDNEGEIK